MSTPQLPAPLVQRPLAWLFFSGALLSVPLMATLYHPPARALPQFGALPAFSLTDEAGQPFTRRELTGHVWVVDFVFTSCSSICPRLTTEMQRLTVRAADQTDLRFLSISVDPLHDTPEKLQTYAKNFGADLRRWKWLTGSVQEIEQTVVGGFKMALEKAPIAGSDNFNILHSSKFALVDTQGNLRGFYDSNTPRDRDALLADARALIEKGGF